MRSVHGEPEYGAKLSRVCALGTGVRAGWCGAVFRGLFRVV